MTVLMQTRQDFIRQESQQRARSDDSHLAGGARYTVHEWQQWLSDRELSEKVVQAALALWKARFQVKDMRRETASQRQSAFCIQRAFETRLWPIANGEVLFEVSSSGAEQPAASMAAIHGFKQISETACP